MSTEDRKGRQYDLKKPCGSCPFARATPGDKSVQAVNPLVLIGQAQGPFALPCHNDKEYLGAHQCDNLHEVSQCAGSAIFRANMGLADRLPEALHKLPPNTELVFASYAELLAHFAGVPLETAEEFLKANPPEQFLAKVLSDPRVKVMATPKGQKLS